MSLMHLNPAVKRLRRVAKAHAAGEISRWEYRETRRQIIRQFSPSMPDVDDTLPRVVLEPTLEHSLPDGGVGVTTPSPRRIRPLLWGLGLLLVTLLMLSPLPGLAASATTIPATQARDPNPATAQRLAVLEVRWQLPKGLDKIAQSEIDDFLNAGLSGIRTRNKPLDHGFTADELTELGRFLDAVGVHEARTRFTRDDILDLAALVQAQKSKRGVSTVQLETLAVQLQAWLRERGYPLATAYLPGQVVTDGVVHLGVELGRLQSVVVQGADQSGLGRSLGALLGEVVERDLVVTRLNVLNRTPGIQTSATFAPSEEMGMAELRLQPQDMRTWLGGLWSDNYGVADSGEERIGGYVQRNQLMGGADMLRLTGFSSLGGRDHTYGRAEYHTPVLGGRFHLAGSVAAGDVQLDGAADMDLQGTLLDLTVTDTRLFTRRTRLEWQYRAGMHDLRGPDLTGPTGALDQRSTFVGAQLQGHRLWDASKVALEGHAGIDLGRVNATLPGEQESWWRLSAGGRAWQPVPFWPERFRTAPKAVFSWRGQLTGTTLPASQRLAASGVEVSRGFARGTAVSLDNGVAVRAELHFAAPLGTWWGFVDSTYGTLEADDRWQHNTSLGLGWSAQLWESPEGRLSSTLSLALPVAHKGELGDREDGAHLYWRIGYER
ncbi:MAG: POTRA domain-containing protein [Pseudomonadota bacterium]